MKLILAIALLIGSQIGLSDALALPALVAQHGGGSFLMAYLLLKLAFILPLLQAELVAGRMYRLTPFEIGMLVMNRTSARWMFALLLVAVVIVMAMNVFNTSWALMVGVDAFQGKLLALEPLDQNLYWFEQSANTQRTLSLIIAQGILLMTLGAIAWRGLAFVFLLALPLVALFMVLSLPNIVGLFFKLPWHWLSWGDVLVAMQHAITSSMVGLLVWFVVGTKLSDRLPTGRVVIGVQLFDVLFGFAMLAISWNWISDLALLEFDAGSLFRALIAALADTTVLPISAAIWLLMLGLVGLLGGIPLLLLIAHETREALHGWVFSITTGAVVILSSVLIFSNSDGSSLMWYGQPIYTVLQQLSQGVIVPTVTLAIAIWIGWLVAPNQVLKQINPRGGIRYAAWRLILKFIVPFMLVIVFGQAAFDLAPTHPIPVLVWLLCVLSLMRLYDWSTKRAKFHQ